MGIGPRGDPEAKPRGNVRVCQMEGRKGTVAADVIQGGGREHWHR